MKIVITLLIIESNTRTSLLNYMGGNFLSVGNGDGIGLCDDHICYYGSGFKDNLGYGYRLRRTDEASGAYDGFGDGKGGGHGDGDKVLGFGFSDPYELEELYK